MSLEKGDLALACPVPCKPGGGGMAGGVRTMCCSPIGGGSGVLLNVQVPGGYSWRPRLRRQIGLQGGDKCQPKPIKIPQFWLSDLVPPPSRAVPEQRASFQSTDPSFGAEIPDLEERLGLEQGPQKGVETAEQRPPNIPFFSPQALQR